MNILDQIYDQLQFDDKDSINPKYDETIAKINDSMEMWRTCLSAEDFNKLDDFYSLITESFSYEINQAFKRGFKLSSKIMCEVFGSKLLLDLPKEPD